MNEMIRPRSVGQAGSLVEAPAEKLVFLRKVYSLFTGSVVTASTGALVALYAGADLSRVTVPIGRTMVTVPPLVGFFANHWIIGMMMFLGAFFGASMVRERPGVNVAALFGASFVSGLYIAPMLWFVQVQATQGTTLSPAPVRDAFLLTVLGFTGLTSYALLSKRDFSFLGGFLSMGLWVLIGASLLSLFVGGASFSLAIASVGVLLFGGYILFDTSRILRDPTNRDAVGAAIGLYLNFLNLFLFLLRILGSARRSD
ncbi:MAG TPA: Bax inhibitor-1/YccA family protein [Polyangiaceae bacterium]|jgi:modulator of FtsH protease|nr:Bax inhibitor-1/YccA family protein [Polyangiaceae bacterium]